MTTLPRCIKESYNYWRLIKGHDNVTSEIPDNFLHQKLSHKVEEYNSFEKRTHLMPMKLYHL